MLWFSAALDALIGLLCLLTVTPLGILLGVLFLVSSALTVRVARTPL